MVPIPLSSTPSDVPSWGGIVLGYDPNEKDIAVSTASAATNFGRDRSSMNAIGRRRPTREETPPSDGSASASIRAASASSLPPFVSFVAVSDGDASSSSSPAGRSSAATKSPVTSPTRRATTDARGTSAATISATNARATATLPSSALRFDFFVEKTSARKSQPPTAGPAMYPTPMALSRIPFARAMFSCGTSLVIITRHVVLMNADAHPQSRRETVHTATVVNTRVSSHEGKDDDPSDSDASASLVYISASHRVYGPAKGITASMQSASAASARVKIGLAPTRHRIFGT